MSGTFPTNPNFSSINFKNNRPALTNQTLSGKRNVRQIGAQYFSFTVQMPPMQQEKSQEIYAFLQAQKQSLLPFQITPPLDNLGSARDETDILVNGAHVVGDSTIAMDGFTAGQTGVLKAGDLIKFANHSKVYMVSYDVDYDSAAVTISPPLVTALTDNLVVTVNKPLFTVYLENDELAYSSGASGFTSISFDVREVIV
jgi:hypothetical protein